MGAAAVKLSRVDEEFVGDDRLFGLVLDAFRAGLAAEREAGGTAFREKVARIRNRLLTEAHAYASAATCEPWQCATCKSRAFALTTALQLSDMAAATFKEDVPREVWRRRWGNPVYRMWEQRKIDDLALKAAFEIQDVAAAGALSGAVSAIQYDEDKVDVSARDYLWPPGMVDATAAQLGFAAWRAAMAQRGKPLDAVLDVVTTGISIREAERKFGIRNGILAPDIKEALEIYVAGRGWRLLPVEPIRERETGS